jgi:hypothetical protein
MMFVRRAAVVAAVLAGGMPLGSPAHAADPSVTFTFSPSFWQTHRDDVIAGTVCTAVASPGEPTQVVVSVTLTCSLNDVSGSTTMPGNVAVASIVTTTDLPVQVCAEAVVTYVDLAVDPTAERTSASGPYCATLPT